MTVNEMRSYISGCYSSMSWKDKVSRMPTRQVYAVYNSLKRREEKLNIKWFNREPEGYHQIDMFEYLYSINQGKETHTEVKV